MGNIIKGTSQHVFGSDKILHKADEPKTPKKIYPMPIRGRGFYAFFKLMNG